MPPSSNFACNTMEVRSDFKDLLELLNARAVDFVVVDAHAIAHHGCPRLTGDIDVPFLPTEKNIARLLSASDEFDFGSAGITEEDLKNPHKVIQLVYSPVRIDLMSSISGVSNEATWCGREAGELAG